MATDPFNCYGDRRVTASLGHGADISTQRADDLDLLAVEVVVQIGSDCRALDIACGLGGQAVRLAQAGARVVAADLIDLSAQVLERAAEAGVADRIVFLPADLRRLGETPFGPGGFDVICCQRAIHYLRWQEAVQAVGDLSRLLRPGGLLFLSASGLDSELGDGYPGRESAPAGRYAPLAAAVAEKHGIAGPVCLYTLEDLRELFLSAGLTPERLFHSEFGNVKGIARRPRDGRD